MKKFLNNKGYMLVEIILASAIAMGVAYFVTNLTIKLKNKNDDLLVKTIVYTEQAIIYNEIAEYLYTASYRVECEEIEDTFIINDQTFTTEDFKSAANPYAKASPFYQASFKMIVSDYAKIGPLSCNKTGNDIVVTIPIKVKQLPNEDFDIVFKYRSL